MALDHTVKIKLRTRVITHWVIIATFCISSENAIPHQLGECITTVNCVICTKWSNDNT